MLPPLQLPEIQQSPLYHAQAVPDMTDLLLVSGTGLGCGWLSGAQVSNTTPSLSFAVAISAGTVAIGGVGVNVMALTLPCLPPNVTDRRDIVLVGVNGVPYFKAGTPCAVTNWSVSSPLLPPLKPLPDPSTVVLAEVYIPGNTPPPNIPISPQMIVDKRMPNAALQVSGPMQGILVDGGGEVYNAKHALFGARGDYRGTFTDGLISNISPNDPHQFQSASHPFVPTDVGKSIQVMGAGAAGGPFTSTIVTYVSTTTVLLADSCLRAVAGAKWWYGHDDSAALQALINKLAGANTGATGVIPGSQAVQPGPEAYLCLSKLVLPGNAKHVTLVGYGAAIFGGMNDFILSTDLTSTGVYVESLTIQGLQLDGSGANDTQFPLMSAFMLGPCQRVALREVEMVGMPNVLMGGTKHNDSPFWEQVVLDHCRLDSSGAQTMSLGEGALAGTTNEILDDLSMISCIVHAGGQQLGNTIGNSEQAAVYLNVSALACTGLECSGHYPQSSGATGGYLQAMNVQNAGGILSGHFERNCNNLPNSFDLFLERTHGLQVNTDHSCQDSHAAQGGVKLRCDGARVNARHNSSGRQMQVLIDCAGAKNFDLTGTKAQGSPDPIVWIVKDNSSSGRMRYPGAGAAGLVQRMGPHLGFMGAPVSLVARSGSTGLSADTGSTDRRQAISVTVAASLSAGASIFSVVFAAAYETVPYVTVTPYNQQAAAAQPFVDQTNVTTAGFTIDLANPPAGGGGLRFLCTVEE